MTFYHKIVKKIINYDSENSFAFKLRKKRAKRIMNLIDEIFQQYGKVNILDIGGTKTYWNIFSPNFLIERNVHITIVNLPYSNVFPENDEIFTFKEGDGCNLSEYANHSFHLAHSNSVIEHLGNREEMVSFAQEMKRVGRIYYLQTPNYWFPVEPHFLFPFFHWLPIGIRIILILNFNLGAHQKSINYTEAKEKLTHYNLLTKKELIRLFPHDLLYKEYLLFCAKSLIIVKNNKL